MARFVGTRQGWGRGVAAGFVSVFVGALFLVEPVVAHAFGGAVETRFALPAWVMWAAGGLVVAVSFAVVGAFLSRTGRPVGAAGLGGVADDGLTDGSSPAVGPFWARLFRGLGLVGLLAATLPAFVPHAGGILPGTLVWLGLWAALPLMVFVVGDVWALMDPFVVLGRWADALRRGSAVLPYPSRLGAWPSVVLLVGVIGFEVAARSGGAASDVASLVAAYVVFTFAGMVTFGAEPWRRHVEVFGRVFRVWGRMAFLQRAGSGWRVHAPGAGLRTWRPGSLADVVFVVAMLLGVNYDTFLDSGPGGRLAAALSRSLSMEAALVVVLFVALALFVGVFFVAARAMRRYAETLDGVGLIARWACVSIVPIAAGYHMAHNLFFVIENLPRFVLAWTDPLGLGWSLFSFAWPATLAWPDGVGAYLGGAQVLFILTGHVLAVGVAHGAAFAAFPSRLQALRSEIPLTVVMIVYTLIGLWLVSLGPEVVSA